jgi:hypothetical protein
MSSPLAIKAEDKDFPLREDIRLLGRILGDTNTPVFWMAADAFRR